MTTGLVNSTGDLVAVSDAREQESNKAPAVCANTWLPIKGWLGAFPRQVSELTGQQRLLVKQIKGNNAAWKAYCQKPKVK